MRVETTVAKIDGAHQLRSKKWWYEEYEEVYIYEQQLEILSVRIQPLLRKA